jgi:large subunit ribosomal protein L16
MLIPKKLKHRKQHRGRTAGKSSAGIEISFGTFALKAQESSWITARQIEAARRAMTRYVQRGGKIWIRIFPDKPVTVHGNESPMGGGKGAVDHFVAVVKRGRILFEMDGVTEAQAKEAMRLASYKLPVKTKFLVKEHQG